jgi:peptide deformylase
MAILKIARMGHPVLGRIADPVADPTAPEIIRLVTDMVDTMADAPGIGLAAPQVHVPLRVVVFYLPRGRSGEEDDGDAEDGETEDGEAEDDGAGDLAVPLTVLINPEIEPLSDDTEEGWEGCLSLPDMTGRVPRYTHIRYRGTNHHGEKIDREAHGMHARVVQHECDHLDGILYPMRMADLTTFGFKDEMARTVPGEGDDYNDDNEEDA